MGNFKQQFLVIFKKNFLLGWRSRELTLELCLPLVAGILVVVKDILPIISFLAPILVALAVNVSTRSILIRLVEEKSERYKETQKIMGLSQSAFFFAYLTSSYIRVLIGAIIFLIPPTLIRTTEWEYGDFCMPKYSCPGYKIGTDQPLGFWNLYITDNMGAFFGFYIIYAITAVHQSFALSTLFSDTKMAGEIGTFITTLTTLLAFLVFSGDFISETIFFVLISLFPQPGVAFGYIAASLHNDQIYKNQQILAIWPDLSPAWSLNHSIVQMVIMLVVYIVLFFYLEEVIPNEYGVAKHPLFFFSVCKPKKKLPYRASRESFTHNNNSSHRSQALELESIQTQQQVMKQILDSKGMKEQFIDSQDDQGDFSSALYHEQFQNPQNLERTVVIKSMTKQFGELRAVNKVTLCLYEKNIFCLLGHNGAGKTTAISVLTGLISKTAGSINMYGLDLENDIEEIRQTLGICNQRDCLYEDMTFEENLRLIAEIKGCTGDYLQQQVEDIIIKTKTQGERNKLVKELSGGNKRKLSLGMALIADSKIVFLDEPTSGMDTISRRKIWDILETVRNENRTIVLTTHHLDEAEVLADRIGIMARGKLLAVGTSEFIKKNFGVGYHLTVSIDTQGRESQPSAKKSILTLDRFLSMKDQITNEVLQTIPNSELNEQTSNDTLQYLLPFNQQGLFSKLFDKLEKIDGIQINLEMNSLEDAFINIGMDEEKFIENKNKRQSTNIKDVRISIEAQEKETTQHNNFEDIYQPPCLTRPPVYRFKSQLLAIFLRKFYYTIRTFSSYVAIVIPLILLIAGVIIINNISLGSNGQDQSRQQIAFLSSFTATAYSFNGGAYVTLPVLEREMNLKYALNVMGCRVQPYWFGTFLFDFIVFVFTIIIFFIVVAIGGIQYVKDFWVELMFTLISFGFSYINWSYMCGFLFQKSNTALKAFPAMNFFLVFCIPWSILGVWAVLNRSGSLGDAYDPIGYILNIIFYFCSPIWTFSVAQIVIGGQSAGRMVWLIRDQYWGYCLIMIAQGFFYMFCTLLLEQKRYNLKEQGQQQLDPNTLEKIDDQNVINEKQRVQQQGEQVQDKIIIRNMWKQYENGFVAIKDVSYGVEQGQIYGLLGPNGAGKSTTFNILTSLIPRSQGEVRIKNIPVNKGIMSIYQDVGICPQFDCLWGTLTPVEHLYLFGRMKGLQSEDLNQAVTYFLQTMQLTDFVKTKAGRLSGGNKRKLCVSNALIGGPDIQFFDEPSTGVDPIARRFLWNTLSLGSKLRNSSIVLTTHQMQEAETLCQKIGILINGRFYCLGTPQELRNKYGQGYNIQIKAQNNEFSTQIFSVFKNAKELADKREGYYQFQIDLKDFSFFKAFNICEQMKEQNQIEDFSINQSSLEQVFVYFSQFQYGKDE